MKWVWPMAVILSGVMLLVGCKDNATEAEPVRFISMERIMSEAGLAEQEAVHLKAVRESLMNGAEKAKERYASLEESKRREVQAADTQILTVQWRAEQQAARQVVLHHIQKGSETWMKENNVRAILPLEGTVAIAQEADVTAEIISQMKGVQLKFSNVPVISLKQEEQGEG